MAAKKAAPRPRPRADKPDGEAAVLAKITQMPEPYRTVGKRLHEIIMKNAPGLTPRVRYGMPWYMKDGKSWCFFRAATKFNFMTFGFDDPAILTREEGVPLQLVASAYRITTLDEATETKLSAIVRKAAD
ncbi:MAG TPA: DUF1801 domain-containing protein [Candidatus Acidoferrales bacterium]|nr:DUF1801 domain-containing protein [Candidatus Acidoferrales bacterium]